MTAVSGATGNDTTRGDTAGGEERTSSIGSLPSAGTAAGTAVLITVVGPRRRADLAVPSTETLGALTPLLARRLRTEADTGADTGADTDGDMGAGTLWLLQRIGDGPLDPALTVAQAGLVDGEVVYLVPTADPMAELTYDDVADGVAHTVAQRTARWGPHTTRTGLLLLAGTGALLLLVVVARTGEGPAAGLLLAVQAWLVVLLAGAGAIAAGRVRDDRAVELICGLAAASFAAVAGLGVATGTPGVLAPSGAGLVVAGLGVTSVGGVLIAVGPAAAPATAGCAQVWVWAGVVGAGLCAVSGGLLVLGGTTPAQAAAVVAIAAYLLATLGPRAATRLAALRVPVLPRSSDDLQDDVEPLAGRRVEARAAVAEGLLTTAVITAGAAAVGATTVLGGLGWAETAFAGVLAAVLVLQARVFVAVVVRAALLVGGALSGAVLLLTTAPPTSTAVGPVVLVLVTFVGGAVLAVDRLPGARLLPVWGRLGEVAETLLAVALVPLLLTVLGVFATVRGFFG